MLNDDQHAELKRLLKIAGNANGSYSWAQCQCAREDMAKIIDPEHWINGMYFKTVNLSRATDEELRDMMKPNNQRELTPPSRAERIS